MTSFNETAIFDLYRQGLTPREIALKLEQPYGVVNLILQHMEVEEPEPFSSDIETDADTLRMVGWGTDEDYGFFDGEDF